MAPCYNLCEASKISKLNISWISWCYLLKFSFVRNLVNKKSAAFSLIFLSTLKWGWDVKTNDIISVISLINNSVNVGFSIWLDFISDITLSKIIDTIMTIKTIYSFFAWVIVFKFSIGVISRLKQSINIFDWLDV